MESDREWGINVIMHCTLESTQCTLITDCLDWCIMWACKFHASFGEHKDIRHSWLWMLSCQNI